MNKEIIQRLFTTGYKGVIAQGEPAGDASACLYRDSKGNKCMLGHSIPDSKYQPTMEGNTPASAPVVAFALGLNPLDSETVALAAAMQRVTHDNAAAINRKGERFIEIFKSNCGKFAKEHGLEVPIV